MDAFVRFGPAHSVTIVLALGLTTALIAIARHVSDPRAARRIGQGLAAVLIANKAAELVAVAYYQTSLIRDILPMHLCDWATFAAIAALIWRKQPAYDLTYFWGLGGTVQAVLTPDLPFGFPDPRCVMFFVSHCGIICAVTYLTFGLRMRPVPASILRTLIWCQIYLVAAAGVNLLLGTNYGYLCRKPQHPSALDLMSPWPLYILELEFVALSAFAILYLPFFVADKRRRARAAS